MGLKSYYSDFVDGNYWAGLGLLARKTAPVGKNIKDSDTSETSVIVPILWARVTFAQPIALPCGRLNINYTDRNAHGCSKCVAVIKSISECVHMASPGLMSAAWWKWLSKFFIHELDARSYSLFLVVCKIITEQYTTVYKKLNPLKFKLSASYCINLTALNASNEWSAKTRGLVDMGIIWRDC